MTSDSLPEDQNWIQSTGLSRRHVLGGTAVAAGFALAAQPISATTITTDADGLDIAAPTIDSPAGAFPAYRARPAGTGPAPVIVVVHEIFGIHEWIKDICRRLAKAGYYAIAPDLFHRHGNAAAEPDFQKLIAEIVSKASTAQVLADIDTTVAFAATDGGDTERLGITGFCWGGTVVWLYAAHSERLDAGVAWYGRIKTQKSDLRPTQPLDFAGIFKAPVLGLYGSLDRGIPVADVEEMNAALKAANSPSRIDLYPEADHGFLADYRPSYNDAAAKDAWQKALGWFEANLK